MQRRIRPPRHAGGVHALHYTLTTALRVGPFKLAKAMLSRNACKTCALGMGGQQGGMVNELGRFPEVCKKSLQAMAADMQGAIDERFFATYSLRALQTLSPRELETSGRLTKPLLKSANGTHYREISWDEAFGKIAEKLRGISPEQAFFYFSGRSSNEAAFLLNLFARVYGTNHVNNCSYYCHQASGVGLGSSLGVGTATVQAEDLEKTGIVFLVGGNPASNHPRLMTHLLHLRRGGGRVVVVNPVREVGLERFRIPSDVRSLLFGSDIATDYVEVHIGGDQALLMGIGKALLALPDAVDAAFIAASTDRWDDTRRALEATPWESIERQSGVTRAEIERLAKLYADAPSAIFAWTMGITHHVNGVENVQWLTNLALMRGMVGGKPHAGLLPIRGHSNVQGIGTVGVTPALRAAVLERFTAFGIAVPAHAGLDTMGTMEAARAGKFRCGFALGGNLWGSNPDATFAREALAQVDLLIYLSTSLNTGHAHGLGQETMILPVLARDEEPHSSTQESMFSFVRLSDGGKPRHEGPRAELQIAAELAARVLGETKHAGGALRWAELGDADKVRGLIAELVPEMAAVRDIGTTKREFHIPGRAITPTPRGGSDSAGAPRFKTASGRAQFIPAALAPIAETAGFPLRLMTCRSEGQFNTVVYEDHDFYRGQERRDVILLNPADIDAHGLRENETITVRSPVGTMDVLVRAFAIKPGNAMMYYPEANVLVPRALDPQSKTPAFKHAPIRLERNGTVLVRNPAPVRASGTVHAVAGVPQPPVSAPRRGFVAWLTWFFRRRSRPQLKSC